MKNIFKYLRSLNLWWFVNGKIWATWFRLWKAFICNNIDNAYHHLWFYNKHSCNFFITATTKYIVDTSCCQIN
jgi:hypothetical protein